MGRIPPSLSSFAGTLEDEKALVAESLLRYLPSHEALEDEKALVAESLLRYPTTHEASVAETNIINFVKTLLSKVTKKYFLILGMTKRPRVFSFRR